MCEHKQIEYVPRHGKTSRTHQSKDEKEQNHAIKIAQTNEKHQRSKGPRMHTIHIQQ